MLCVRWYEGGFRVLDSGGHKSENRKNHSGARGRTTLGTLRTARVPSVHCKKMGKIIFCVNFQMSLIQWTRRSAACGGLARGLSKEGCIHQEAAGMQTWWRAMTMGGR